jgi:mannose-6-phosphate isomerase-like protein (cupin superfamily)/O-acetyl-ADP-ribose deacetylase (regulator of RNase III)
VGEPVLVPFGGGEIIGDSPERRVEILSDDQLLHATWSRFGPGREGADLHVHRRHSDLFYVLEGELTVRLGIQDEPVVVSAGTLARAPPYVVHGFRNGSDAELRYLNFHAPGQGFADFLRALGAGRAFSYDQHPPPSDGGLPPSEAVVGGEAIVADQPGLRVALLADVEEIGISEVWSDPGRPAPPPHIHRRHLESFGGLPVNVDAGAAAGPVHFTTRIEQATVHVEVGRIEEYASDDARTVVALPANEYFDDECVNDVNSALGAYVDRHFKDSLRPFLDEIHAALRGLPSERVPRAERRVDDSYGIGQAIYLRHLAPSHRVILVSATTERTGIGLRAEPHFLYAAMQGVVETMNANRLDSVVVPVLGSGHGGMPLVVALLFNLLAVRSCLTDDVGRHIRQVRIVVFEGAPANLTQSAVQDIAARVLTS